MNRYFPIASKIGGIGGFFCVVAFLLFIYLEVEPTNFSMIFGYIILPLFLFLGIRYFKIYQNAGLLSFAEGMTVGFFIYSIIGIISGLGIWLILLITPGVFSSIKASKIALLESNKTMIVNQLSEESFNITYQNVISMTAFDIGANDFIWKIIPGLFFTIIISIILRKL
jgi:hypothetical protein